jgi:hypothetical protein
MSKFTMQEAVEHAIDTAVELGMNDVWTDAYTDALERVLAKLKLDERDGRPIGCTCPSAYSANKLSLPLPTTMNNDLNDLKWELYHKHRLRFTIWCKDDTIYGMMVCIAGTVAVCGGFVAEYYLRVGAAIAIISSLFAITCYFRRHF